MVPKGLVVEDAAGVDPNGVDATPNEDVDAVEFPSDNRDEPAPKPKLGALAAVPSADTPKPVLMPPPPKAAIPPTGGAAEKTTLALAFKKESSA